MEPSRTLANRRVPSREPGQQTTRSSCDPCRAKKVRCSGEHPVCSRCLSTNRECAYSTQMRIGRPRTLRSSLQTCACSQTLTTAELLSGQDTVRVNYTHQGVESAGNDRSHQDNSPRSYQREPETI
ncbi:hypothetical protein M434DRAFT_401313, partial [Hypoxylon sp. CO27-5]